jgi:DNA-directed RNA polymerase specialized sigma24 family protein
MDEKTLKIIKRVCHRLAEKFTFGFYDPEDIEQEAFIMALAALPRFNPEISCLETFLHVDVCNKLKTFKRDHFQRTDFTCSYCGRQDPTCEHCQRREWRHAAKKHLMEPIDIDHVNGDTERNMYINTDFLADIELSEIISLINMNLDIALREDYLKMLEGITIPKVKRQVIEAAIFSILEDNGYYDRK